MYLLFAYLHYDIAIWILGDNSLGKRRYKEACELYKVAARTAASNTPLFLRIREKEDMVMKIISLEVATLMWERWRLFEIQFVQSSERSIQSSIKDYCRIETIATDCFWYW